VGKDAQDAAAQRLRKEAELNAKNNGVTVVPENGNGRRSLAGTAAEYFEEVQLTKKPKTLAAYSTALGYFQESCSKEYVQDIDRRDLLNFAAFLRDEKGQSARSVYDKFESVMTFLKAQGIRGLLGKNDWPRFVEGEPEIYEQDGLDKFFSAPVRTRSGSGSASSDDGHAGARGYALLLVRHQPQSCDGTGHAQARS
jgi:hypothetical protein